MARSSRQPGFRFHPTDVELIMYYLKRKVLGKPLSMQPVAELDLYKFSPWDLPDKSCWQSSDLEWYFFCPRDRKYSNGPRTNRATENGYWKTTGRDRAICNGSLTVGMKKTLIFHLGKAPHGSRTDWVMHEYMLQIKDWIDTGISQDSYVLCKVFEKSGAGPRNGEQHGAPFKEEEWEDDMVDNSLAPLPVVDSGSPSNILDDEKNALTDDRTFVLGKSCEHSLQPPCRNASPDASEENLSLVKAYDIDSLFAIFSEENDMSRFGNGSNEMPELWNYECYAEAPSQSVGRDIFCGLEDLNNTANLNGVNNFLANTEDNVLGRTLLWDCNAYLELDDLDRPMIYPLNADDPKHMPYDNLGSRLEMESGDNSGLLNSPLLRENVFPMGLDELGFPKKYPLQVNSDNAPSADQFGCYNFDNVEGLNYPLQVNSDNAPSADPFGCYNFDNVEGSHTSFVSLEPVYPARGVESSECMLPRASGLFADNLHIASNDHIGFGGTSVCGHEGSMQTPEVLLCGNGERVNPNSSQSLARGEQHTATSRLECLLGSIPTRPAFAAEFPSSINAGKGYEGMSLFPNLGGSSIHVKAEVTLMSGCTEEALSEKLGECPYKFLRRKLQKKAALCSSGFTFLFLGVGTAQMWVFFVDSNSTWLVFMAQLIIS